MWLFAAWLVFLLLVVLPYLVKHPPH